MCASPLVNDDMREMTGAEAKLLATCSGQTTGCCQSTDQHSKLIQVHQWREMEFLLTQITNRLYGFTDFSVIIWFGVHAIQFISFQDFNKPLGDFITCRIGVCTYQNTITCWSNNFLDCCNNRARFSSAYEFKLKIFTKQKMLNYQEKKPHKPAGPNSKYGCGKFFALIILIAADRCSLFNFAAKPPLNNTENQNAFANNIMECSFFFWIPECIAFLAE